MNYTEIIERQEEMQTVGMAMQKESQELQDGKIEFAQSHTSITLREDLDPKSDLDFETGLEQNLSVQLTLNYDRADPDIIELNADNETIILTVDQFNKVNMFLQKHNDVIFSYMSEITKKDDEVEDASE